MSIKQTFETEYKKMLFVRQDFNENVFYFSSKDFDGLNVKTIDIKSSKQHNLKGYFYYYDSFKKDTLVIFEHGMGPGHQAYMKEIEKIASHGYLVFAYDHTGCASSQGSGIGGFAQSLCDSDDVVKFLKQIKELEGYKYYVVGHSMGGYSTLNVVSLHNNIEKIVSISAMISVKHMHNQIFSGIKGFLKKYAYQIEKENNPNYIDIDVINNLKEYKGKALILHSTDDKLALYKYHFKKLYKALKEKENFTFITCKGKNHNPNYTYQALAYKDKFFEDLKENLKDNKLDTIDKKDAFKKSYDWNKITEQDDKVWKVIFDFLDA